LFSLKIGDWIWRVLEGLQALTGASKAFGDVLSYLRLFALGLASAQLATTFNDLAHGATEMPGVGILLALLIVLVGHGINLLLGIVSGVVHGLRLNCIEFFSWSLTDEGYPFRAFCKKAGC
jgi:V/A-type H+-transporting ATPase subunit I